MRTTFFSSLTKGFLVALLLVAGVALAAFVEPTGSPYVTGSNAIESLNVSATQQEKIGGTGLGANFFTANNEFCLNGVCITSWPTQGLIQPTSCHLETKQINGSGLTQIPNPCDQHLTAYSRAQGWFSTGFDKCSSMSSGSCNYASSCHYMRLVCSGAGIVMESPTNVEYTALPVTGATSGDAFTFLRAPQCFDGLNNDAATGIDYPADPQCQGFWDDSESVF